ncbi:MAG: hypothetical protein IPP49_07520 [Saprospiraceae bacterium]|nr:hypothetical protein [Saprospiraceae bacterium]
METYLIYCFICANMLFAGQLFSQTKYTKADVREMFPSNTKDLWINYLSGTLDDKHVADMIIGTDGHTCKGLYTMRSSNTTFFFDGEDRDHQLRLVELTANGRTSGFIYGNYDGEKFYGQWMNGDKNLSLPFQLRIVNSFDNYIPAKCHHSQWQRIFAGRIDDKPVRLHIQRDKQLYSMTLYEGGHKTKDVFIGDGSRVELLEFKIENSVLSRKWATIDTSNLDKLDIIYLDDNNYEVSSTLKAEAILDYECYEYADYYSKLESIRPLSKHKKFDIFIENSLKKWLTENIEKLKNTNQEEIGTKDRWIQEANSWVEVDLFLDDIISGTIYMQTSWSPVTEKKAFIFDLKNGKEMILQDIFDNKFASKSYFDLVISDQKENTKWSPEVKNWIEKQKFDFVTLSDEGILFKTPFSTIYGEKEILVPYTSVAAHIKNKNLLKDILIK